MKNKIQINGKNHFLESPTTLKNLLEAFKIHEDHIAIAVNDEVVPRSLFLEKIIQEGDRIEMIRAVQGG